MPNSPQPPRWKRRAEARPQELLDAALTVFVEQGYAQARLEEIAERAGVAKATLYRYYESKLDLFQAVVRNSLVATLDGFSGAPSSARDRLVHLLTAFMERVAGSQLSGIPKLIIAEAGNIPELDLATQEAAYESARAAVAQLDAELGARVRSSTRSRSTWARYRSSCAETNRILLASWPLCLRT